MVVTGAELVGNELGNYELVNNATGVITVKKATLNVGLNDVVRTYGNAKITSGSYSAGNITGLVNGDSYKAGDVKVTVTGDGALTGKTEGKVTNNAGDYTWSGTATTDNAGLGKNYNLVVKGNGKSDVTKANLVVNLNDITEHLCVTHAQTGAGFGQHVGRQAHVLHAAGDDHLGIAAANGLGGQVQGFQARPADLVQGHGRHGMRQAGADGGLACGVLATACGKHLAEDHFIDLGSVEAGLLQQAFDDDGAEFRRGNIGQAALEAADGGAGGGDDDDVLHG